MRIAVAGGTGRVGRLVVEAAGSSGHEPVVLARSAGVDLTTGAGLDAALAGVAAVIDVSDPATTSRRKATAFYERAAEHLLPAEQRAGIRHHVVLSIVGIDRLELGYYRAKQRQEALAMAGPVPASVLRATQFHEFTLQVSERGGRFALAPVMRSQPIAAREVAAALLELALSEPAGLVPELAGPRAEDMAVLVSRVVRAGPKRRIVVPVRLPGRLGRAMAGGALLPKGPGPRGQQTFDEWFAAR